MCGIGEQLHFALQTFKADGVSIKIVFIQLRDEWYIQRRTKLLLVDSDARLLYSGWSIIQDYLGIIKKYNPIKSSSNK